MNKCRSCGAEIRWAKTPNGKTIPLDAKPRSDGKLAISDGGLVVTVGSAPFEGFTDERYVSHFATCPNANIHRRKS